MTDLSRSRGAALARMAAAARTPGWSVAVLAPGALMATRDSGAVGFPWVVFVRPLARGYRAELYRPGDDVAAPGEVIGEFEGNPRESGRRLRELLAGVEQV